MQNLSAAHRQISASTIGQYRAMTTPYRDGTWTHDVSQNIQALLAAIAGAPPYRILDLGCGPGRDLVTFRDLGHVVVGLDGCPEFVAMARAVSGCEVWQQDLLAMSLPRASFDGVFANAVLFHVPSRALPGVLDRLHAMLKPGGVLLASNPRGQDRRASSMAVTPASTVLRPGVGWSATAVLPWSTIISARPASLAASSRGSPRSGASQQRLSGTAPPEGATGGASLVRRLRRFAGRFAPCGAQKLKNSAGFRRLSATGSAKCEPGIAACR
jgi:SAM-dependent methyltransferase